jgi:ribose-phosphate pyrophosphokinase
MDNFRLTQHLEDATMFSSNSQIRAFPIAILATPSGRDLAAIVDRQLREIIRQNGEQAPPTFVRRSDNPRFQNGEGKAVIIDSIRGTDLFIIVDMGNYGVGYRRNNIDVPMSPDDHFQDLKRLLGAAKNMAQRITVIMPLLYESRQHKMQGRESLDCALALQELVNLGVDTIMTIDAHNSHVMNAIPRHGLENLHGAYQLIEAFIQDPNNDVEIDPEKFVMCSPDLGGMERARYFAEHFQVHLTGFYKYRDLTRVVDGKNPVLEHKFLGSDVAGKDILVVDDLLASGGSLLEVAAELRRLEARDIYFAVTYGLFSSGIDIFDKAYKDGLFKQLYATNATYVPPEYLEREWFVVADTTKFIAKFVHSFNQDHSITRLLDSTEKINKLLGRELLRQPVTP